MQNLSLYYFINIITKAAGFTEITVAKVGPILRRKQAAECAYVQSKVKAHEQVQEQLSRNAD